MLYLLQLSFPVSWQNHQGVKRFIWGSPMMLSRPQVHSCLSDATLTLWLSNLNSRNPTPTRVSLHGGSICLLSSLFFKIWVIRFRITKGEAHENKSSVTISPSNTKDGGGEEVSLPSAYLLMATGIQACSPSRSPHLCEVTEEPYRHLYAYTHRSIVQIVILRNCVV